MAMRNRVIRLLLPLLLTAATQLSAQNLTLTLASRPPLSGTLSTRDLDTLALRVVPGQRVTLSRSSGRDYRLQAGRGLAWTQVQEIPLNEEYLAITPVLQKDGSAELTVDVFRKAGARTQQLSSTILAQPGEWVQLLAPLENRETDSKSYGTRGNEGDALYLRFAY